MRFSDLLFAVILCSLISGTASAQSRNDVQPAIQRLYGKDAKAVVSTVHIDSELAAQLNERNGSSHPWSAVECWRVTKSGEAAGWAFVDNVKGKSRPITYLMCFDRAGSILDIEILEYRESHGGEVASEMFRAQFRGKSDADKLQVGRGIRNISGATISSRSVTKGARALATLARHIITTDAR